MSDKMWDCEDCGAKKVGTEHTCAGDGKQQEARVRIEEGKTCPVCGGIHWGSLYCPYDGKAEPVAARQASQPSTQPTLEDLQKLRNEAIVQASSGKPCWWERVKAYDIVIDLWLAQPSHASGEPQKCWYCKGENGNHDPNCVTGNGAYHAASHDSREPGQEVLCPSCRATDNDSYTDPNGVAMRACGRCMIQWRDKVVGQAIRVNVDQEDVEDIGHLVEWICEVDGYSEQSLRERIEACLSGHRERAFQRGQQAMAETAAQHWPIGELGMLTDFRCSCGAILIGVTPDERVAAWQQHIRSLAGAEPLYPTNGTVNFTIRNNAVKPPQER